MLNKKAISPVIGSALLIVVSIVAVIGFQNWYSSYGSTMFADTEQKSKTTSAGIDIEYVTSEGIIFVNNRGTTNTTINNIDIGEIDCNINEEIEPGVNQIDISSCLSESGTNEILITTDSGLYEEKIFIEELDLPDACTLDSITRNNGESYTFYNSSLVPFGESCSSYSLVRTCNDGTYSGDSTYNKSSCSVVGQDTMPDAFSFTDQTGVSLSTIITSNSIVPTGYDGPLSVGITGDGNPELSVNGGGWTISTTMNPTETLEIRLNSSNNVYTSSLANLTLGNYSTIWNVTTGSSIQEVNSYTSTNTRGFLDLKIIGNYAYGLSNHRDSLTIFDISNPNSIVELDTHISLNMENPYRFDIVGNYAYIAAYGTSADSLTILDISNPNSIVELDSYTSANLDGAKGVSVVGNYAYVVSENTDSLTILSISNPNSIVELDSHSNSLTLNTPYSIDVVGNYAYVAGYLSDRVTILDISNPNSIVELDNHQSGNLNGPEDIQVIGNYAYVVSYLSDTLTILDISNPNSIVELDSYTSANLDGPQNIHVVGDYAYVTSFNADSLTILNISNPNLINEVDSYSGVNLDGTKAVYFDGNYIYVTSAYANRLTILEKN